MSVGWLCISRDLKCAVFAPFMKGNVNSCFFVLFFLQESDDEEEADSVFQEEEPCTQTEGKCFSFVQWQRMNVFERV